MTKIDYKNIKKILELVNIFENRIAEIASAGDGQERLAALELKKLADKQLAEELKALDVSAINKDKLGIRVSALRDAGIENMEKLCSMSYKELSRLNGISEETAYLIYKLAGKIKQELASGVKVRIYPENMDECSGKILVAVKNSMDELSYVKEAQQLQMKFGLSIKGAVSDLLSFGTGFKRFFVSATKKKQVQASANYLYDLLASDYGKRAQSLIRAWDAREKADENSALQDFVHNSAAYYAKLDKLDKISGTRIDNSYSGIPAELVSQVEQQKISLDGLKATLRSYQDFGVRYIIRQQNVLLGDEMGLGKTVQAIAAMVSLRAAGETHFMVVCPASVLVNWAREIKQFSELDVVTIQGGDISAVRRWQDEGGVAVTTYGSISRFGLPEDFSFGMLVADEAHYIKNPLAIRTQSLLILKRRAKSCLFMTGTPLENNVDEMCFIIKCLNPQIAEEIKDIAYFSSASQFREKLAPVYLRRTREDVLTELPALIEKEQWCKMGKAEWESYLLSVMSENFMAMRQVSWDVSELTKSSKAKRLLEICSMAEEEGRKLIVFSFFRSTIDAVAKILGDKAMEPITGSVSPQRRQQIVDEFSAAPKGSVLLCQVQAGGTGLNIQAASVIIFCEPQIKPSIENQAISRAYRMGQLRTVVVHRLLCDNTVDERILEILRDKQDAFESFAEVSAAGSEYMKGEKSIAAAIIAKEKQGLAGMVPENEPDEENEK